mgnify:CR=1 FL=1
MNTTKDKLKKLFRILPETWFLVLFAISTADEIYSSITHNWEDTGTTIIFIAFFVLSITMVMQIVHQFAWIRWLLGLVLIFTSFIYLVLFFQEYNQYPLGTEARAIQLLTVGLPLICMSFLMAISMFFQGVSKLGKQ